MNLLKKFQEIRNGACQVWSKTLTQVVFFLKHSVSIPCSAASNSFPFLSLTSFKRLCLCFMSLNPHLIFNPQPTAIWLQPTLFYWGCSCQLCYDLLFVTSSRCISAFIFILSLNTFDPLDHSLSCTCSLPVEFMSFDSPGFLFNASGYFFTVLFLDSYYSAHLLCADPTEASLQGPFFYFRVGSIIWSKLCNGALFVKNIDLWSASYTYSIRHSGVGTLNFIKSPG